MSPARMATSSHRRTLLRAQAEAERLPPLLAAAERVASSVAQGVHGRRRTGTGESFWQFRPFSPGDTPRRIDWRQSARSGQDAPRGWFIRETEWEAAQTVFLWTDRSDSMQFRSAAATVSKLERADLLLLALASLLLRGGERVRLLGAETRFSGGQAALEALAMALDTLAPGEVPPLSTPVPPFSHAVLIGDFLAPLEEIRASLARLAALPVRGCVLQILDPAEVLLPYEGRVRFTGMEADGEVLLPRVNAVREEYARRLAAQQEGLAALCAGMGFTFSIHRTDRGPELPLLALHQALADSRASNSRAST
ncbi:Hypothetical protein GbCGDNIH3_1639 [Granulibacter bethesdensis]|uniref:DUF58 domain-containing protein n=2 Tax=Granulibacter bethesdensis TaxID=364410 RepID=A0AAN0VG57_9PROT|nr:Hypothetical protein GbCGDNIH3_1639 [Granulibacter bethesdensis]